jgi:flagellar hook assembly protein FlgD
MKYAGICETVWDGKDDIGNSVSSGVYYYQIRTKDFCKVMKMIYMK